MLNYLQMLKYVLIFVLQILKDEFYIHFSLWHIKCKSPAFPAGFLYVLSVAHRLSDQMEKGMVYSPDYSPVIFTRFHIPQIKLIDTADTGNIPDIGTGTVLLSSGLSFAIDECKTYVIYLYIMQLQCEQYSGRYHYTKFLICLRIIFMKNVYLRPESWKNQILTPLSGSVLKLRQAAGNLIISLSS